MASLLICTLQIKEHSELRNFFMNSLLLFSFLRLKPVLWGLWMTVRMNQWNSSMCG